MSKTHQMSNTRMYGIWCNMKNRCYNKKVWCYKNYGGRGIKVCDRWKDSFINFWEDMKDGYSDELTIDRIDVNGDYCPENCKWSTTEEQKLNKRNTLYLEYKGKKVPAMELAKKHNINYGTLHTRLIRGWSVEDALTKRVHSENTNKVSNKKKKDIVKDWRSGKYKKYQIAKKYGVSPNTVTLAIKYG